MFPLCSLAAETRIGPDHTPLLLRSREELAMCSPCFYFEAGWFQEVDFVVKV